MLSSCPMLMNPACTSQKCGIVDRQTLYASVETTQLRHNIRPEYSNVLRRNLPPISVRALSSLWVTNPLHLTYKHMSFLRHTRATLVSPKVASVKPHTGACSQYIPIHTHTKQIKTSKAQHSNARSEWFCAKGFQTMQQIELSTLMSVLSIVKCWFALFLQISLLQLSLSHDCFGKNTWHIQYGYIWCIWVNAQRVFTLEFLSSSYMPISFMRLKESVGNPVGNPLSWRAYVLHVVFELCVFARSWFGVRDQEKKSRSKNNKSIGSKTIIG
jgi:hypothetical protein